MPLDMVHKLVYIRLCWDNIPMPKKEPLIHDNTRYGPFPDGALCPEVVHPNIAGKIFFPDKNDDNAKDGGNPNADKKFAKQICALCGVRDDCLGASFGEKGIWAGLGDRARRNLNNRKPQDP